MSESLITRIESRLPRWNREVLTESYFFNFCRDNGILYGETDLISGAGEYLIHRNHHFIFVHIFCNERYKNWVRYHELAHFLWHAPGQFDQTMRRKMDFEANVFASVALLPIELIQKYSWSEIIEMFDYPIDLLLVRLKVFERYGI